MGWIDSLRDLLRGSCEKLVKYQSRKIEFSGFGAEVGGAKFSLGEFKTETEKIESASEMAKALDDYQYLTCRLARELSRTDPERKVFLKVRSAAMTLIMTARITFEAFKIDPKNQASNLDTLIQRMQHFSDSVVNKATEDTLGLVAMPGHGLTGIRMEPITYLEAIRQGLW